MWICWLASSYLTRLPRPGSGCEPWATGPVLAGSPPVAISSYVGFDASPDVAYSFGWSSPMTEARPWAPPFSAIVDTTDARSASMKTTPASVATAVRVTLSTRIPGSLPSSIAVSRSVLVVVLPGEPRTIVVPGDAVLNRAR